MDIRLFTRKYQSVLILLIVFFLSRLIYFVIGIRFDAHSLLYYLQFIDPALLVTDLWQSIFYLHSQPPLFNLWMGIVLKVFQDHYIIAMNMFYLGTGLVLMLTIFSLMKRFHVNEKLAVVLTAYFMLSPAVILYENWLMYSYFEVTCLCLAALFLNRYLMSFQFWEGFVFFSLLAVLILIRSTFHIIWFLFFVTLLTVVCRHNRKQIIRMALIPFFLIFIVYFKNFLVFGNFTTSSSWLGVTLVRMTVGNLTDEKIENLVRNKKISIISALEAKNHVLMGRWIQYYQPLSKTGVKILDQYEKPTSGSLNFNSMAHLKTSAYYVQDSRYVLSRYPEVYFKNLRRTYFMYLFPGPTDVSFINRQFIMGYENFYNFLFAHLNKINQNRLYSWQMIDDEEFQAINWDLISRVSLGIVILFYLTLVIFGGWIVIRNLAKKNELPLGITLFFLYFNIIYITMISNGLAYCCNNRYRFAVDPFYLIFLGIFLQCIINKFWLNRNVNNSQ